MTGSSRATLRADALCLLTAAVWGAAFVAQRVGMEHVGPLTYNGVRFLLGALVLVPLVYLRKSPTMVASRSDKLTAAAIAGGALFVGATLQQIGLLWTTAGKGGFLTSFCVALVPIFGLTLGQRPSMGSWIGAALAVSGAYFLSVTEQMIIGKGDVLVILCAIAFAWHILFVDRLVKRVDGLWLAMAQFFVCGGLSLVGGLALETFEPSSLVSGAIPILYGGICSVGIGYTLQVIAQRHAPPAHAVILLSMESVFAAIFGCWLLAEPVSARMLLGSALMLGGIVCAVKW